MGWRPPGRRRWAWTHRSAGPWARTHRYGGTSAERDAGGLHVLAELWRQGEDQALVGGADRVGVGVAVVAEVAEDVLHEVVRHRGSGGDADGLDAVEPCLVELRDVVDAVGRLG